MKLSVLLISILVQVNVYAQSGYGKASYNTSQAGTFMKSWLVAGPISVSTGNAQPDQAQQEKAFKNDVLSTVNVASGKPLTPVQVNQKPVQWKLVSSAKIGRASCRE